MSPRKIPPTKMLITSACFQRITSYLVHIPFVHDHFTKLPVCRSKSPIFIFSPKCVLNDPLGVAGTLACGARNCQWHEYIPLYGDCPDPGCNSCLQVTDCLGAVFVHSVLQIIPEANICLGGGGGGINRVSVAPTQSVPLLLYHDESILESLP